MNHHLPLTYPHRLPITTTIYSPSSLASIHCLSTTETITFFTFKRPPTTTNLTSTFSGHLLITLLTLLTILFRLEGLFGNQRDSPPSLTTTAIPIRHQKLVTRA
ncbi:hypothetical protein HanIR_Chr15g0782051 [Helianthus annuus]|nr:hypothetical protein HanIR_Chr15g0782051 [Helianthus annuus]